MTCKNVRAMIPTWLAGELDQSRADELQRHTQACPNCAAELRAMTTLAEQLRAHPGRELPEGAEARVLGALQAVRLSDQPRPPSPSLRRRVKGVFTMKRSLMAVGLLAVLVAVGIGLLPGLKSGVALAQVARAMGSVKTAHLVAQVSNKYINSGAPYPVELWVKLPSQFRFRNRDQEVAEDGQKSVTMWTRSGVTTATIAAPRGLRGGVSGAGDVLALFDFRALAKAKNLDVSSGQAVVLSDGRPATRYQAPDGRLVITVDNATGRVEALEGSTSWSHEVVEHIDYDQDIPDSVFELEIPKNAVVMDLLHPPAFSAKVEYARRAKAAELEASGAWELGSGLNGPGCGGSPLHPGMNFQRLDYGWSALFYFPQRNSYYVVGRWVITDEKTEGFSLALQDAEFTAPRPPQPDPLPAPRVVTHEAKPGEIGHFSLQNLGPGPLTIIEKATYEHGTVLEIRGRAKHIPDGEVYQEETVKEDELWHLPSDTPYPAELYWGNLPADQRKGLQAFVDLHNRVAAVLNHKNAEGYPVYNGAEVQEIGTQLYSTRQAVTFSDGKLQLYKLGDFDILNGRDYKDPSIDWTQLMYYVLKVPDRRLFLCFGHVKVKYPGKPDRRCVNGIVTFDGENPVFRRIA